MKSTERAGTARFSGSSTISPKDEDFATTFDGEVDFASGRSTFVTRALVEGKAVVQRTRFVDDYAYFRPNREPARPENPEIGPGPSTVKEWIRSPYSGGGFGVLESGDAAAMVRSVARVDGDVESLGTETVRGVDTKHYRLVTRATKAPREVAATRLVPDADRVIEVWVDAQHRVRRLRQSIPSGRYQSSYELELFDFGAPVAVEAPPAADTTIDGSRQLTGDWRLVQHGRSHGEAWRVFRAPTAVGACFAHESGLTPRSVQIANMQRGKQVELCTQQFVGLPGTQPTPARDLNVRAVSLPDGMALLYGSVSPSVQTLTLHFARGRTQDLTPADGAFAAALGGDELVNRIELQGAPASVRCPLVKPFRDYNCEAALAPSGVVPGS